MRIFKYLTVILLTSVFTLLGPAVAVFGREVIPGGQNIGMELRSEGLVITGLYDVKHSSGTYNPSSSDIKRGDMIISANGVSTNTVNQLLEVMKQLNKTEEQAIVNLTIKRNDKNIQRDLKIYKSSSGTWKTGLFVKEKILGIGTITYYDAENSTYGALGHEIIDNDSGRIYEVSDGTIYNSDVISIKKSQKGTPGEKIAQIEQNEPIGTVEVNTKFGVYGFIEGNPAGKTMEVAEISEVQLGQAEVWTVIKGKVVEKFSIEITNLKPQTKQDIKGITFKITDKRLLDTTNGIVQGMSGSPIIQNNKIVGAVTHVLVDNPNSGYGIYLIYMLEESDKLAK